MRTPIWRSRGQRRWSREWWALSAWSLAGRHRRGPRRERTAGVPRTRGLRASPSLTFAAENAQVNGGPWLSHSRWNFESVSPRSVGFGPVFTPLLARIDGGRRWPGTSPVVRVCPVHPESFGRSGATVPSRSRSFNQRWAVVRVRPNRPSAFSQEHPEAWTNSTVVSTAPWPARGRPVFGVGGSSGWMISQSPSGHTSLTGRDQARRRATSQGF